MDGGVIMTLVCADKQACDERFSLVYEMTYNEIRKFASCRCGDPQHLPDLLQEIYLEYYRTLRRRGCDYVRDDRALILKIASRRAMRYYSLKQRMRQLMPLSSTDENGNSVELDIPDPALTEDSVITSEESAEIAKEISRLPAETRKIIYLYYAEEMSLSEIAGEMNMKLSTVKTKLYRGVERVRKRVCEERS